MRNKQLIIDWLTDVIHEEYQNSILEKMILPIFVNNKSKKLRPLVVLLCYRLIAGEDSDEQLLKYICSAIEICHNASLIVDDVFDRDELRRGKASFFVEFGTFAAISSAYNLSAFVFDLAARTNNNEIVKELGRVGTALSSALYLSKDLRSKEIVSEEFFMDLLHRKTSALFESSARCGGLLATNDKEKLDLLGRFGKLFGYSYQLRDDVLAIIGSIEELGKEPDSDITNRFQSLITIEAFRLANTADKKILSDYYLRQTDVDPETIRSILIESGAINAVIQKTEEYREEAGELLNQFPDSVSRRLLLELLSIINFNSIKQYALVKNP